LDTPSYTRWNKYSQMLSYSYITTVFGVGWRVNQIHVILHTSE